ncbi:bifunctional 2-keto-4-hydroxyglutarate aldolase/2-keto-3-deoxy-6-phosphogluconate aldolase [Lentilactobacillus curieae]|uniref:Bifunctional 2-keto-4-hydroxyglutarate aldolase/2-keto-3-deoxy-6-phosphogluconate aldolase n=1 Tax=Lentilactobacillus curieae TaxID=1138822 RepID=A0A1S6QH15_9LACO|nr:bifunctional 2-keto-4-hydroxyglutarate aldolase/2-keto-3-deoxy-6-phosphogluconate aldolase [Lentilactobacillus curieae]AQW20894.1 bifunctional 2-keto-4-hydroxyglutarate aldolase/2-keto-3-deoxy-6-phosphogluconate aldolase [Lentilactobacillus curieae]
MKRVEILNNVKKAGVVAVVRGDSKEQAIKTVDAIVEGGVKGIELTFTVPNADQAISELNEKYAGTDVMVGAGTVLDPVSARIAIIAGAKFIVSPSFNEEVAKISNLYQIPYIPGTFTNTEIQHALEFGADIVKLFPGSIAQPGAIKEIHGPFPYVSVMPSGGVNADNLGEWKEAGALIVGVGGSLSAPAAKGDYAAVTANAKELISKWNSFE